MSEITKKDYEKLLQANERQLWELTEQHYGMCGFVKDKLWPKVDVAADLRAEFAEELAEYGCEVDA